MSFHHFIPKLDRKELVLQATCANHSSDIAAHPLDDLQAL